MREAKSLSGGRARIENPDRVYPIRALPEPISSVLSSGFGLHKAYIKQHRIISDREWREVINEIWNSYKIYEICKHVILVYVEMLLKQEFCDRFTKNPN